MKKIGCWVALIILISPFSSLSAGGFYKYQLFDEYDSCYQTVVNYEFKSNSYIVFRFTGLGKKTLDLHFICRSTGTWDYVGVVKPYRKQTCVISKKKLYKIVLYDSLEDLDDKERLCDSISI